MRSKRVWNGHGIEELVNLAIESSRFQSSESFMKAFNFHERSDLHKRAINEMVFGKSFANTRKNYATRNLGYGEVCDGDFSIVSDLGVWVDAVKNVALNSDLSIQQLLISDI